MESDPTRRRGRPAGPAGNALGEYLRRLRARRGMTVRELAKAVGLPITSAAYVSQLEAGAKVPSPELAAALAHVLEDKQDIFYLWSQTGRRSDPTRAAHARQELARLLDDPSLAYSAHFMHPMQARIEGAREHLFQRMRAALEADRQGSPAARWRAIEGDEVAAPGDAAAPSTPAQLARRESLAFRRRMAPTSDLRVPLLPEGVDPDSPVAAQHRGADAGRMPMVRIAPEVLRAVRAVEPFAYRLGPHGVRRVEGILRAGDVVVVTREVAPHVVPHEIYAVRLQGEIVLSLVMWNGRELLLLPSEGSDDFIVLPAGDPEALAHHIVGHVATVIRYPEAVVDE